MDAISYLIYQASGSYAFNQSLVIGSNHMNADGVCFGISTDWMRYTHNHTDKDYIVDKYNVKYATHCRFDIKDGGLSLYHTMNSANYYNRINYFQHKACMEWGKGKLTDFINMDNNSMPDKSFIFLEGATIGHACAYKINNTNGSYQYVYFDPNFGETFSGSFANKSAAVADLKSLVTNAITKYKVLSLGLDDFNKETLTLIDGEKFTEYLTQSWKNVKADIDTHGTYENSMNYSDFPDEVFKHDYYQS